MGPASAQVPVLSQQGNLCRRLWGGREETITSAILSEGGEGGRREEDLARTWQRAVGKRDLPSRAEL